MNEPRVDWRIDAHVGESLRDSQEPITKPQNKWQIGGGRVDVWHASVEDHRPALNRYRRLLTADEVEQSNRLRFLDGQAQYVVTRGLLRLLLAKYLDRAPHTLSFRYNPFGKPELLEPDSVSTIKFNVSHSHGQILVAFAHGRELGVDLEFYREISDFEGLARRYFAIEERAELAATPAAVRLRKFFNFWTLKEAFIKAQGMGLSLPLDSFHIVRPGAGEGQGFCRVITHDRPDEGRRWALASLDIHADFAAAVAAVGHDWSVEYRGCSLDFVLDAGLNAYD